VEGLDGVILKKINGLAMATTAIANVAFGSKAAGISIERFRPLSGAERT
tara:strand:- start:39 stop:185 length:147 start_codon:yes stop_codon:yes gene_type:complete